MTPLYRIAPPKPDAPAISPYQYGQFVEYLADLVPGMWAEKLEDGGFDGVTPYAFTFLKETDWQPRPWYPWGAVNRSECAFDENDFVQGKRSLRIRVADGPPCTVGIAQDGIAVRRRVGITFTGYLKAEPAASVTVQVVYKGRIIAQGAVEARPPWQKQTLRLIPIATADRAHIVIAFRGPGTLWLDCLSLMPDDAVGGWRRDVVDAVRALKPGIIRFGGSVVESPAYGDYDWRKTIGPVEQRQPFRAWGGLQPIGAGLEEIVQFIQAVGAEPLLCVRFTGSSPEEAAAQVEYFNGSPDTPMGAWRARNGRSKPYGVKYWQVGNEVRSEEYDRHMADFCRAMRRVDPTIKILSCEPTEEVIRSGAGLLDYLCPHHYGCHYLAYVEQNLVQLREATRRAPSGRPMKVAVTEWNTTAGDWGPSRAMLWTLANALACARYHNLLHRYADIVEIANRSNLVNSFCAGILQTNAAGLYCTPTYYAQQLYANRAGRLPLPVEGPPDSLLDISATLTPESRRMTVFVVNDTLRPVSAALEIGSFGVRGGRVRATVLTDTQHRGEPDAANSADHPKRIVPVRGSSATDGHILKAEFQPLSLTVLEWTASRLPDVAR